MIDFRLIAGLSALLAACSGSVSGGNGLDGECGNAVVEGSEECDLGLLNNDTAACKSDCTNQVCGDGFAGPDEACDDANDVAGDGCEPDCTETDFCGNGLPNTGEECDDGNAVDTDACLTGCIAATCGDEIVRIDITDPATPGYEQCDDGNRNSDFAEDACRTNCLAAHCGDSVTDKDEECDNGAYNSDTEPNACREDCHTYWCGDGVHDGDEECDNGEDNSDTEPNACRTTCDAAGCGDGVIDNGEHCDDAGDSATCDSDCTRYECGDGYTNPEAGEDCDDSVETETCDIDCTDLECGDGYVNLVAGEECDSQDVVPNGVCSVDCVVACSGFWENCNGLPDDGCERDLHSDPDHCGECYFDCGGGECVSGECQPLKIANLAEIPVLSDVIVHEGVVYATTEAGIVTVPADAEGLTTPGLLHDSRPSSRTLTIEADELYFTGLNVPETGASGLHTVDINDGTVSFVNNSGPLATGADTQHLYYVSPGSTATLVRYAFGTGGVEDVGDLPSNGGFPGVDIIVEPTVVFSVDLAGTLWRLNKDPADPQPVPVATPDQALDAESDATHVYWAEPNSNTVFRINKDPFACLPSPVCAPESFGTSAARPWALAIDATHVYWVAIETVSGPLQTARLERRAKTGEPAEVLILDLALPPTAIAEAGEFVFWVVGDDSTPGELWKLRKPR
ncbi:hypothetical protein ACFL6C_01245 [Myxococcota bacterium]